MDRFLQQALLQVMTPIFDGGFSWYSYGFRPGKRAHEAVWQAQQFIRQGYRWVVDMDLEKFFDRVNHDILMARVARKVQDKRVLKLIRACLNAGVMVNGAVHETEEGTPQGGPLSPLLANILLDDLDKELARRGLRFVRYADDCNIFVASNRAGERVMESVIRFVEGKLKLKVNREKSAVDRPWKRKFLGFSFLSNQQGTIRLAPKTIDRFKERIRAITSRTRPVSMEQRIEELNHYIMGWVGYFHIASAKNHCESLDQWIRRRLRMCLWKQWKRVRTRCRELRALGVPEFAVRAMANSRRGAWEMSRNLNNALDTSYWEEQGLKSLTDLRSRSLPGAGFILDFFAKSFDALTPPLILARMFSASRGAISSACSSRYSSASFRFSMVFCTLRCSFSTLSARLSGFAIGYPVPFSLDVR
jgi:group II intron reverse transcriptase/maturase